jgi:GINS complex subunit 2
LQFGPFRPPIQVIVPYWLAVILKKQGRCTIVPPRWLHMHLLGSLISLERTDDVFQA